MSNGVLITGIIFGRSIHIFRDLFVYKKAHMLTKIVREQTKLFPRTEMFGLSSQIRRAADSIVLNIAEGAGNSSQKEFPRFLDFSIRSGFECLGCCDIAEINNYLEKSAIDELNGKINEVIAMLYGLKNSLKR
jgi:four helix bundle protein